MSWRQLRLRYDNSAREHGEPTDPGERVWTIETRSGVRIGGLFENHGDMEAELCGGFIPLVDVGGIRFVERWLRLMAHNLDILTTQTDLR